LCSFQLRHSNMDYAKPPIPSPWIEAVIMNRIRNGSGTMKMKLSLILRVLSYSYRPGLNRLKEVYTDTTRPPQMSRTAEQEPQCACFLTVQHSNEYTLYCQLLVNCDEDINIHTNTAITFMYRSGRKKTRSKHQWKHLGCCWRNLDPEVQIFWLRTKDKLTHQYK